jgi:hypothetical protein
VDSKSGRLSLEMSGKVGNTHRGDGLCQASHYVVDRMFVVCEAWSSGLAGCFVELACFGNGMCVGALREDFGQERALNISLNKRERAEGETKRVGNQYANSPRGHLLPFD